MRKIEIQKSSITDLKTDVIVNAANAALQAGSGVCGAIFKAAGYKELQEACDAYGHCDTGSAVITPGFRLFSKYIIHAVGPVWQGGKNNEPKLLYDAYYHSLRLASEYSCTSIGFPLISAGIYGYPLEEAWKIAIKACKDFLKNHQKTDMHIVFAVLDDHILQIGRSLLISRKDNTKPGTSNKRVFDKLYVGDKKYNAVYFHKPQEPDGYLSNWYLSPFDLDGKHFTSCEQYIMYRKCLLFRDMVSAEQVLSADDISLQQMIGRNAKGYNQTVWEGARQAIALRGLIGKFQQNEVLKEKLLLTGNAYLVECAKSDCIWACGRSLHDERRLSADTWNGTNLLGFALMEVRELLHSV